MSRTSPFFVPQKEVNLINDFNEELIDEIVGQSQGNSPLGYIRGSRSTD